MAEEVQYASGGESVTNKRKYEDQTSPLPPSSVGARRTTGFSAPIASQLPDSAQAPPSYNSVPPIVDGVELAKQKAQEIANRIYSNVDPKRPRVENGSGGFDSIDGAGHKALVPSVTSPVQASYGYQGTSKKIDIPNGRVGVIIGKSGETIKYLQLQSGAKIQVTRDVDADLNSPTRMVELMGTPDQIAKAEQLIHDVLNEADKGGSGIVSRRITGQQSGADQFVLKIPNNKVGLVIGKGGETIKGMQARTGARVQVIPLHLPPGDTSTERTVQIDGTSEQIEAAKQLVNEVISENHLRNPAMSGGYPQQGYQAQPQTSWAPPGPPMQQPGYGYVQPGAYPGPSPQYNMSQPPYSGYPPQQTSGGYATGWDQSSAPPNQQTSQGSGYDYYSQQPQQQQTSGGPSGPADGTGYGYSQPPVSGYGQQGAYPQDGYGGYHTPAPQPGYGQPQPNPVTGYEQQQGYNSAPAYGNVTPAADGHTTSYAGGQGDTSQVPPPTQTSAMGQQGYNTSQPPGSNPVSYPPQVPAQAGYGVPTSQPGYGTQPPSSQPGYGSQPPSGYGPSYGPPQGQKPASGQSTYGQPQQSPSAQGGYAQPGYPHSQPPPAQVGYGQPDAGAQRAPPTSYSAAAAQPGYGPPYGAPPVSQPGYGQQQPPPYNSSYGSGYSQPPVYPPDGSTGAAARGTYDSAPASQAVQPSAVAKASPQS